MSAVILKNNMQQTDKRNVRNEFQINIAKWKMKTAFDTYSMHNTDIMHIIDTMQYHSCIRSNR